MRRFLSISFIALVLVVAAGATPAAHAQSSCPAGQTQDAFGTCTADANAASAQQTAQSTAANTAGGLNANGGLTPAQYAAAANTPTGGNLGPSTPADYSYNGIMAFIASLFAWLLGVAAITLDNAVYYTVVTMGSYVHNLTAVGIAWRVLRDIGNIVLIFGFLAIGITTILDVKWYGGGFKMLPMLLVAAVFLNFSLFLSEAVIDTGNLFATQFYTQINGGTPAQPTGYIGSGQISNEAISNKIMDQLGLQTIYGKAINAGSAQDMFKNSALIGFMSIIFFLIAAFVFFSLAFILIARFVILLFLIIIAPIGFAGLAIPQLKGTADKWWSTLFEQTITAPVLLLLLYIAILVITDTKFLVGTGSDYTGLFTGNITGFATMVLSFLVAMGLLLAVVIISKKLSAFGAAGATKLAGKLSFGATAWAGRTTVGWGMYRAAKYLKSTKVGRIPLVGTGLVRGLDKIGTSSFDMRGVKMGGGLKGLGIETGEAQKGGYKADLKARTESRTKYAAELTGRELNDDEKLQLALHQKVLATDEKQLTEKRAQQMRNKRDDVVDEGLDRAIRKLEENTKKGKEEVEKIENLTDKGAQRDYAKALNLWSSEKNFFNKYINFAANTDAAKIIRATAKKGKPDKDFSTNMKNLLKEAAKEVGEDVEGSAIPPAGGASTTPPAGHTESSGGVFVPSSSGGGPRP